MEEKKPQLSQHFPDNFYRVVVKGLYVKEGKVLLVHDFVATHKALGGRWELPGGGVDFGEMFQDALKREIKEEMDLNVTWVADNPTYMWTHKRGPMRGMDWHWVLTLAYAFDLENLNFKPSEECRDVKFFTWEDLQSANDLSDQAVPLVSRFNPKDF